MQLQEEEEEKIDVVEEEEIDVVRELARLCFCVS